jgi:hypothetical protein
LLKLRYDFVGSPEVQIALSFCTTSASFFGFSRRRGVAVPVLGSFFDVDRDTLLLD